MSGFRKLVTICNKQARDDLNDYYVIKEANMNNLINCLEDGARQIKQLQAELAKAKPVLDAAKKLTNHIDAGIWSSEDTHEVCKSVREWKRESDE